MTLVGVVCALGLVRGWPGAEVGTVAVILAMCGVLYVLTHWRERKML